MFKREKHSYTHLLITYCGSYLNFCLFILQLSSKRLSDKAGPTDTAGGAVDFNV